MPLLKQSFVKLRDRNGADEAGRPGIRGPSLLRAAAAHRIRVGLTGLAAIFLIVLIAAAGVRPTRSMAAVESQAEPLAVLGLAPGAGQTADASGAPPPPRPSRT